MEKKLIEYSSPTVEIVLIADDVVRTSSGFGPTESNELPFQPW